MSALEAVSKKFDRELMEIIVFAFQYNEIKIRTGELLEAWVTYDIHKKTIDIVEDYCLDIILGKTILPKSFKKSAASK